MKHYAFSALLASFMICGSVTAAPAVTGLAGTITEGATVVVSGSGFGAFGGEIVSWDDFEAQTSGAAINGSRALIGGTWTTQYGYTGRGARFDGSKVHSGKLAAHLDWAIDSSSIRAFGWSGRGPYSNLYISYWRWMQGQYLEAIAARKPNVNHKQFYLFGNNNQMPQMMIGIPSSTDDTFNVYNNSGQTQSGTQNARGKAGWKWTDSAEKWQRWEFGMRQGTVGGQNGTVQVWRDGQLGINNSTYNTKSVDGQWVDFRLGHMTQQFSDTAKAWFDDVYISTTPARVELCDTPTWAQCQHRELQIIDPAQWTGARLGVKLRLGGFPSFVGTYLYVVDEAGNVNSRGYPVLGGEAQPSAPAGLVIN